MEIEVIETTTGTVVDKRAATTLEADRLVREAALVTTAIDRGCTGITTSVELHDDARGPRLRTAWCGRHDLRTAPALPPVVLAAVSRDVALHLAALHEAGLVHGGVGPAHVVLDDAGVPHLVSLGRGGRAGAPAPEPAHPGQLLDPADDVAGLGALIEHLLAFAAASGPTSWDDVVATVRGPGRPRRGSTIRRSRRIDGRDDPNEVLAALATQAQHLDARARPAARGIAAALAHRVPGLRRPTSAELAGAEVVGTTSSMLVPDEAAPRDAISRADAPSEGANRLHRLVPRPRRAAAATRVGLTARLTTSDHAPSAPPATDEDASERRDRRRPLAIWGSAVAAIAILGVIGLHRGTPASSDGFADKGCPNSPNSLTGNITNAASAGGRAVRLADATCPEPIEIAGGAISVGRARFSVDVSTSAINNAPGGAADPPPQPPVVVGDWDCDGIVTPATLDGPRVVVYDAWPVAGGAQPGRLVGIVDGAVDLVAPQTASSSCEPIVVRRSNGTTVPVDGRR